MTIESAESKFISGDRESAMSLEFFHQGRLHNPMFSTKKMMMAAKPTAPPTINITQQPTDQTALNGNATFNVSATASNGANLSYQWEEGQFLQGNGGVNWTPINTPSGMFVGELCELNYSGLSERLNVVYGDGTFVAIGSDSNVVATSPDGTNWTQRTLPVTAKWRGLSYGNGKFVAVGSNTDVALPGVTATSTDGINWTQGTLPLPASGAVTWNYIAYGNNTFVALASGDIAATSLDGIKWNQRIMSSNAIWTGIAYGNGLFVAVSTTMGNTTATSANGIHWTRRELPEVADWRSITYANGMFVALAYNNDIAATSADGINWAIRSLPTTANWSAIAGGGGTFTAVACGSNVAATSTDGTTWTPRTLPATTSWRSVAYGKNTFVTLGARNIGATSLDGMEFSPIAGKTNSTLVLGGITPADAGKRYRVVVNAENAESVTSRAATLSTPATTVSITQNPQNTTATNGNATFSVTAAASDDSNLTYRWEKETWEGGGETWIARTLPSSAYWERVTYDGGIFLALASDLYGEFEATAISTDGINWTQHSLPRTGILTPSKLIYVNGMFFGTTVRRQTIVGGYLVSSVVITSVDGINWNISEMQGTEGLTANWRLAYGDGLFVAVGAQTESDGYVCVRSTDGFNWTIHPMPPEASGYEDITYGNGIFVAISVNNDLATSQDGMTWVARTYPHSDWRYVTYGDGMFVALARGQQNTDVIAASPDGIRWTGIKLPGTNWAGITYGNGLFVAVNAFSKIAAISTDGINWIAPTGIGSSTLLPVTGNWSGIACGKGMFVAVSYDSNTIVTSMADNLRFFPVPGETNPTLNLTGLTPEDNGNKYRVVVDSENAKPVTSSTATLTAN